MIVREQLLVANSRANADRVLSMVANAPDLLTQLMVCFLSNEIRVAQRAAQVVGDLGRSNPESLAPWLEDLVEAIANPVHQAIRRNGVRIFSEWTGPLPLPLEKRLIKLCGQFVADRDVDVAIGAFSMTFIANRSDRYPAEAIQLRRSLEDRLTDASTGFANRARKVLKQLAS